MLSAATKAKQLTRRSVKQWLSQCLGPVVPCACAASIAVLTT